MRYIGAMMSASCVWYAAVLAKLAPADIAFAKKLLMFAGLEGRGTKATKYDW